MNTFTKKFLATLLTIMALVGLTNPATAYAASKEPYCRISYDANTRYDNKVGCDTIKYYSYSTNKSAYQFDSSRLVKYNASEIRLNTENKPITTNRNTSINFSWTADGSYLVWAEENDAYVRAYNGSSNQKIASNIAGINLNDASMASTLTLKDNSTITVEDAIKGKAGTGNSSTGDSTGNTTTTTTQPTSATTPTVTTSKVSETVDSAGRTIITVGNHIVIIDGSDIYANDIKISELCDSGVRYLGSTSTELYLYEDETYSYYRVKYSNLFNPEKLKLASGIADTITDSNGYLTGVKARNGNTYTLSQLAVDKKWTARFTYAINKKYYSMLYISGTDKSYKLERKGSNLYLNNKLVAKEISTAEDSFGFTGRTKFAYTKNGKVRWASLKKPKKSSVLYNDAVGVKYSETNGLIYDKR